MKDNKFYPLLTVSVLFLVVSFVLLCVLGYNFYKQQKGNKPTIAVAAPPNIMDAATEKTRDTLQKMYAATVSNFTPDTGLDSALNKADSTQVSMMDNKLGDVYKLKTEINSLLKDSSSSIADLELARYKINELQLKVDDLKTRNIDVEKENKRLRALLEQFAVSNNSVASSGGRDNAVIERPAEKINSTSPVFSASDLKLSAANDADAEVASADDAEKFVGSLVVRNSLVQGMGEVMLVLIQPDGKVLRNAWESGSFDTDGGKKIYSRKIKFDYNKGESRRINFSVPADNIQKGTYTLQVYNNGKVIGRVAKTVS
ncbi:MAG: hypothetical protein V4685_15875 [Bacteroidota bacterium]